MEPITILIFAGLALAAASAVIFWHRIIEWAHESLFPWFERHLPTLAPLVRKAFIALNEAVMKVRKVALEAWRKLRPRLLRVVEAFERRGGEYLVKVTSYLREKLAEEKVEMRETTRTIRFDDLPDDVQQAFLRGSTLHEFDVTREQDQQMEQVREQLAVAH